ncbi:MAG TPA: hypothetical protein DGO43_03025 [Chloroflexi bacterium]|nr:hypothetical protein [Chloroflexota bacterium]
MPFNRSQKLHTRLALASGFHLGASPSTLAPSQHDLFSDLCQRSLEGAVDQALRMRASAFVICGGLFADDNPSLDHVRGAMAALANAQRADLPVLAAVSRRSLRTDGVQFLTEIGLITHVLDQTSQEASINTNTGQNILFRLGSSATQLIEPPDVNVGILPLGLDATVSLDYVRQTDLLIDARSPSPNFDLGTIPSNIQLGHAAPSLNVEAVSGFTVVEIENHRASKATFVEIEAVRSIQIDIDCNDLGQETLATQINRSIAPVLGKASILHLVLSGSVSRDNWHTVNPRKLVTAAAAEETLVRLDLSGLLVNHPIAAKRHRSSFLVHTRRIADVMASSTEDIAEQRAISSARNHVSATVRAHDSLEAST